MRKIEALITGALALSNNATVGNTRAQGKHIFLHGNHIAELTDEGIVIDMDMLRRYPTSITKSRLRALIYVFGGPSITTKAHKTFVNGVAI